MSWRVLMCHPFCKRFELNFLPLCPAEYMRFIPKECNSAQNIDEAWTKAWPVNVVCNVHSAFIVNESRPLKDVKREKGAFAALLSQPE